MSVLLRAISLEGPAGSTARGAPKSLRQPERQCWRVLTCREPCACPVRPLKRRRYSRHCGPTRWHSPPGLHTKLDSEEWDATGCWTGSNQQGQWWLLERRGTGLCMSKQRYGDDLAVHGTWQCALPQFQGCAADGSWWFSAAAIKGSTCCLQVMCRDMMLCFPQGQIGVEESSAVCLSVCPFLGAGRRGLFTQHLPS